MPFLRVIRDKRGYETTYLMDWYREGARQRSRILYVFRTPGGVRVGRAPLEPEVLRHIEGHYPHIVFDWKTVLDTRQVIDAAPDHRRPPVRRRVEEEEGSAGPAQAPSENPHPAPVSQTGPARLPIPSVIEGATPEDRVAFLSHWYPIARERVAQRMADPVRRDALIGLAELLNPAAWTTAEEVASGLEQASEAMERLSRVLTRRRRRTGRGKPGELGSSAVTGEVGRSDDAEATATPQLADLPTPGE